MPARRAGRIGEGSYIEYRVSYASEQRHGCDVGGTLTTAARIVALRHMRPLRAGHKVRIVMQWETPTADHVSIAQAAIEGHGLRLIPVDSEPKVFIVDSLVPHEGEVHLLAS